MELRDYIRLYWRERVTIFLIMIVAVGTTLILAANQPAKSSITTSYAVNRVTAETTPDYQYDGYYALQAVDLVSQTVATWFDTSPVIQEIYTQAKLDPQTDDL